METGHQAAAQGAADDPHVTRLKPLMGICVIVLHFTRGGNTVEAADDKQTVLNGLDPKIAAGGQHGCDSRPSVCFWVVGLGAAQAGTAVKSTDLSERKVNTFEGRQQQFRV